MTLPRATATAVVDLYLARGRLRAEMPMLGFSRVSDLFNNVPGDFVGAYTYLAATNTRRDLVVRLRDVRLVRPVEEQPSSVVLDNLRDRMRVRVVLDLDDWQVTGEVHLVDRIPWLEFASGAHNRFISVSNASVRFVGLAEPLICQYLLVNGARISALYEVD